MDDTTITTALISQYQAALAMFRAAVRAVPPARWNDPADVNATWRIAYHTLFYTHLYLSGSEEAFVPWELAVEEAESLGHPAVMPEGSRVNTVDEVLAYADAVEAMLPAMVPLRPYEGPSGFSWISIGRFEHHVYNIRHVMQHAGQLTERARACGGDGVQWTGRGAAANIVSAAV